jgi:hypothetical protein
MRSKEWPRHLELLVYEDGRIYDTSEERFLSIMENHSGSFDGPMAIWRSCGKSYTINICRAIYEAFNGPVSSEFTVKRIDTFAPASLKNIKKVPKYQRDAGRDLKEFTSSDWMGPDSVYLL